MTNEQRNQIEAYAEIRTDRELLADVLQQGDDWIIDLNRTYRWYWAIARAFPPRSILEFGVRYGYSAIAMMRGVLAATGSCDVQYIGVDSEFDKIPSNAIAMKNLHWLNRHTATVLRRDTADEHLDSEIKMLRGGEKPFDCVHIDGNHTEQGIQTELNLALRWTKKGSWILVDDLDIPHVRMWSLEFAAAHKWPVTELPTRHELLVIERCS